MFNLFYFIRSTCSLYNITSSLSVMLFSNIIWLMVNEATLIRSHNLSTAMLSQFIGTAVIIVIKKKKKIRNKIETHRVHCPKYKYNNLSKKSYLFRNVHVWVWVSSYTDKDLNKIYYSTTRKNENCAMCIYLQCFDNIPTSYSSNSIAYTHECKPCTYIILW